MGLRKKLKGALGQHTKSARIAAMTDQKPSICPENKSQEFKTDIQEANRETQETNAEIPKANIENPEVEAEIQDDNAENSQQDQLKGGIGFELGTTMVDLYVGPSRHHFHVHKSKLCARIPYFDKMFNSGFLESGTLSVELLEDDPVCFSLLLDWVYSHRLRRIDMTISPVTSGPVWDRIKLYGYAEFLCLPDLCDYIMSNLITTYANVGIVPSEQSIQLAYEVSHEKSPLRRFMIRVFLYTVCQKEIPEDPERSKRLAGLLSSCPDLALDFVKLSRQASPIEKEKFLILEKCDFHTHEVGKFCRYKVDIL